MARTTSTNIKDFQNILLIWFRKNRRDFPWRADGLTHYELVIAEALLQRTKANTVSKLYRTFIKCFPDWSALSRAQAKKISNVIRPLGLYRQRSKRLKNLAVEMLKRNGKLPRERKVLETIPFMGQYIANSVELLIFNRPFPLIDVNMSRVLERYFGERKKVDIRYDPYLQSLSQKIVQHKKSKEINWAILDFAALVCFARNPNCIECIFKRRCNYYRELKNVCKSD